MSATAKSGDTVAVHYTGKFADGSVFDSSRDRDPFEFILGQQRVIPGFEQAIIGMTTGESKTAQIPAKEAYGAHHPEMVMQFGRDQLPENLQVQIGQELQVQTSSGRALPARVVDTSEEGITLDANHPLAGKDLTFDIELIEIVNQD